MCARAIYQLEAVAVSIWIQLAPNSAISMSPCPGIFGVVGSAAADIQISNRLATFFRSDMENDVGPSLVAKAATKLAEVASLFL